MTLRGFLTWYFAAVLLVGTAGATGYHLLSRHRAQLAARPTTEASATAKPPQAMAEAQPIAPGADLPQPSPSPTTNGPPNAAASEQYRRTAESEPHGLPALRPHLAGSYRASQLERRAGRRPTSQALATRPAHHPATLAVATRHPPARQYAMPLDAMPLRPYVAYAQAPPPSVTYYTYPGYPVYRPGYPYYPSPYPYYRVY